jgi:hypothetical protein
VAVDAVIRIPMGPGIAPAPGAAMGGHGWRAYGRRHVLSRPVAIRPARLDLQHRRPVSTYNVFD